MTESEHLRQISNQLDALGMILVLVTILVIGMWIDIRSIKK